MKKMMLIVLMGGLATACESPMVNIDKWHPNKAVAFDAQDRKEAFYKCRMYVDNYKFELKGLYDAGVAAGGRMRYCMEKEGYVAIP